MVQWDLSQIGNKIKFVTTVIALAIRQDIYRGRKNFTVNSFYD